MRKIVVIGGGTGSFVLLSGLRHLPRTQLTAIVPSTDSGGSTGRLRDEFGLLPVGDVRQCLVALAEDDTESMLLRQLLSYRFDKGADGLRGHNMGNLLLTALTEILGSELAAIDSVRKLLNIKGKVLPVSLAKLDLVAEYENGTKIISEHNIDEPAYPHDGRLHIHNLTTSPNAQTHSQVIQAIATADAIVVGPGDLYTSLLANLVVGGVAKAVSDSSAKLIYIVNLVTKFGQTYGMSAADHVAEVTKYAGRRPDYTLVNNNHLPADILSRYADENAYPVVDDLGDDPTIIRQNLLAREDIVTQKGDVLRRSLIRHDSRKIAKLIAKLIR